MPAAGLRTLQDLIPEAILLAGALACVALGVLRPRAPMHLLTGVAAFALASAGLCSLVYLRGMPATGYAAFSDGLVIDRYSIFFTALICALALFAILGVQPLGERLRPHAGEYCALLLIAVLAAALVVAARELIELWVALELLALTVTALVAMVKVEWQGGAAALRLVAVSGAGSAAILYGMALVYGLTGTTVLTQAGTSLHHTTPALALASALLVGGTALKLGAAPLQQWTGTAARDVSAPTGMVVLVIGPVAGVAALARVLVVGLPAASSTWTTGVAVVGIASLAYGSLAALRRREMRGLVGDIAVAQVGLALLGLLAWRTADQGLTAMLLALVGGGVALAGALGAVAAAEAGGIGPEIADYHGLIRRAPVAGVVLVISLLSLAGMPPLLGFLARALVLEAAVTAGYAWLLAVALPLTVIAVVAVIRVVVTVAVVEPDETAAHIDEGVPLRAALTAAGLATVFLGVAAQPLLAISLGGAGQLH